MFNKRIILVYKTNLVHISGRKCLLHGYSVNPFGFNKRLSIKATVR